MSRSIPSTQIGSGFPDSQATIFHISIVELKVAFILTGPRPGTIQSCSETHGSKGLSPHIVHLYDNQLFLCTLGSYEFFRQNLPFLYQ